MNDIDVTSENIQRQILGYDLSGNDLFKFYKDELPALIIAGAKYTYRVNRNGDSDEYLESNLTAYQVLWLLHNTATIDNPDDPGRGLRFHSAHIGSLKVWKWKGSQHFWNIDTHEIIRRDYNLEGTLFIQ